MTEPCMFPNLHEPFYCRIHADVRLRLTDERCRHGVTLTQPQPDACRHCPQQGHTTAWHEAHYTVVPKRLREAAQAVVDDWFGTYDPEVRIPSAAENIEALRAALASSPARPTGDTALREAAQAVADRFGGYPRGFWATEDHAALDALAAALRSTPAATADGYTETNRHADRIWAAAQVLNEAAETEEQSGAINDLLSVANALRSTPAASKEADRE